MKLITNKTIYKVARELVFMDFVEIEAGSEEEAKEKAKNFELNYDKIGLCKVNIKTIINKRR